MVQSGADTLLQDLHAILSQLEKVQQRANVEDAVNGIKSAITEVEGSEADKQEQGKAEGAAKAKGAWLSPPPVDAETETKEDVVEVNMILWELFLLTVIFPALTIVATINLGCFLALMESWYHRTGIEYAMSVTCGLATPLGEAANVTPKTGLGMTTAGVVGLWTVGITGVLAGFCSNTQLVGKMTSAIEKLVGGGPEQHFRNYISMHLTVYVFSPIAVGLFVLVFGSILAGFEKWTWSDGGYYMLANVAGLPNPLINESPTARSGRWFDIILSTWCFMFSNVIIGLGSNLELPSPAELLDKFKACCGCQCCSRSKGPRLAPGK